MKTYVIRLDTVQNLKDYLYMLEVFSFSGVAKSGRTFMKPEDLPLINFTHAPILLMVDMKTDAELEDLEIYLKETNVLIA